MSNVSQQIQAMYEELRAKNADAVTPKTIEIARREGIASGTDDQVAAQLHTIIEKAQSVGVEEFASYLRDEVLPARELSLGEMEAAKGGAETVSDPTGDDMYNATTGADWDGR